MSEIVPAAEIETIVGVRRHATDHYGRADSTERTVYILHSQHCKDTTPDLRDCSYSVALDEGIESAPTWAGWRHVQDQPVKLKVSLGYLMPVHEVDR
jgi:hypothetical protein